MSDTTAKQKDFLNLANEGIGDHAFPLRLRRPSIQHAVWEYHRAAIEVLYIHQGLELKEVMARMKQQHGFDATVQMYKMRLSCWNLRKNYTQTAKQDSIKDLMKERPEFNDNDSQLVGPNGRPLLVHRLWRSVQRRGKRVSLVDKDTRIRLQQKRLSARGSLATRLLLDQAMESQGLEILLKHAQAYYSWYQAEIQETARFLYTWELANVFNQFELVRYYFSTDMTRAFALLNRCCSSFHILLELQPFQLIQSLLGELVAGAGTWSTHSEIRAMILKFFASLASETLGSTHPITQIIGRIGAFEHRELVHLSGIFSTLLENTTKTMANKEMAMMVQLSLVQLSADVRDFDAAWSLCQRLWDAVQPVTAVPSPVQVTALETMTMVSFQRDDFSITKKLVELQMKWTVEATGKPNGDYYGTQACIDMGRVYYLQGQFDKSEEFYLLALEGASQFDDITDEWILCTVAQLELCFHRTGKSKELAQLKIQYAYVWKAEDEWRLHGLQT